MADTTTHSVPVERYTEEFLAPPRTVIGEVSWVHDGQFVPGRLTVSLPSGDFFIEFGADPTTYYRIRASAAVEAAIALYREDHPPKKRP